MQQQFNVTGMSGKNQIGFQLDNATFFVHTSNTHDTARFGNAADITRVRIYADSQSNEGYLLDVYKNTVTGSQNMYIHSASPLNQHAGIFIDGSTGFIGISTDKPQGQLDIAGDVYFRGSIIQTGGGCNTVINNNGGCNTVVSTSYPSDIEVNTIRSSNEDRIIDFSESYISNVTQIQVDTLSVQRAAEFWSNNVIAMKIAEDGNVGIGTDVPLSALHVQGMLRLEGEPFLHVMGNMQRLQVSIGDTFVSSSGLKEYGFSIEWTGTEMVQLTEEHMIAISGACSAFGSGNVRLSHRFATFVNPRDNTLSLPGLDSIVDQNSYSSEIVTKPILRVERTGSNSVDIFSEWDSSVGGYRANMKIDIFAPLIIGEIRPTGFLR